MQCDTFEVTFKVILDAMQSIYSKSASLLSFEELYRAGYNLVIRGHAKQLYDNVRENLAKFLDNWVATRIVVVFVPPQAPNTQCDTANAVLFLDTLATVWKEHRLAVSMVRDVLLYLDSHYVQTTGATPIFNVGIELFRDRVIFNPEHEIEAQMLSAFTSLIHSERTSKSTVNRSAIKGVVEMLQQIYDSDEKDAYSGHLEKVFLQQSAVFYASELREWLEAEGGCQIPQYLVHV
jgi:cullin 3